MKNEITVLVAEDHPLFLRGLCDVLEADGELRVVGKASDGFEAWRRITELRPRVAVLDIAKKLREKKTPTAVLILTMHKQEEIFEQAMDLGILGYVLKENSPDDLLLGIKKVAAGEPYFSSSVSGYLLNRNA